MSKEFALFASSLAPGGVIPAPISSFPSGGLAIFSEGSLHILRNFSYNTSRAVEFEHHTKIQPIPSIPPTTDISAIRVSEDGSRVILHGEESLYILLIELDTVRMLSKKSKTVEVFCECRKIVQMTSKKRNAVKIREVSFVPESVHPGCRLAVLTSDNYIRLYDLLADSIDSPTAIDFNRLVHRINSRSTENSYGLYTTIVAFSFVTCVSELCLLVVDSDGQLYTARILDEDLSSAPIIRSQPTPPGLPCDPTTLYSISHAHGKVFSAFMTYSNVAEGNLCHFVLFPHENGFEIIVQERLNLPQRVGEHVNFTPYTDGTYLLGTPNHLYLIDCRPWIYQHLEDKASRDSRLHVVTASLATPMKQHLRLKNGQTAVVNCATEDGSLQLLITRFPDTAGLVTSFLRSQQMESAVLSPRKSLLKPTETSRLPEADWKLTVIDPILSKIKVLPKITGGREVKSPHVLLKEFELWLVALAGNMTAMREGTELALRRLSEITTVCKTANAQKAAFDERLATFGAFKIQLDEEITKRKEKMSSLAHRLDSLYQRAAEQRPLTAQEKKMQKTLQDYRRQSLQLCDKTREMSMSVAEAKRRLQGPADPFWPNMNSHISTAEKGVRESEYLRCRAQKLLDLLNSQ